MNCTVNKSFKTAVAGRVALPARGSRQVTRAIGDTQLVISGATAVMLGIGRFAAMPYQRKMAEMQVPTQNGETHAAAGDSLANEASFITKTNDPEGFNIVDLLAYGSLGHALGFLLLACSSLSTKPIPFQNASLVWFPSALDLVSHKLPPVPAMRTAAV
eukprot:TRINITY_DN2027_c0_g1_i2.p2 TRINITY_DN2027_c0_g1~~TRINITY_DN2027_c0_g1_i2.p2  ORF type:complete len:184 (-),score=12.72 TRINITY_DN2027_c0_g1_i2:97-573(-)